MVDQESYKQHISGQFNAELEGVKTHMLEMGGMVEQQVRAATAALVTTERAHRGSGCRY
jgi:phosphate transport system protein